MRGPRRLGLGLALAASACTSHERSQEPSTACPEGMIRIAGDKGTSPTIAAFCVDRTEVTTAAYAACFEAGGCSLPLVSGERCNISDGSRGDDPINCASFDQAAAYCARLGKRLPGQGEWQQLIDGGDPSRSTPWAPAAGDERRACVGRASAGTCPVGAFPAGASPAGVVDLVGNVREWVTAPGQPTRAWGAVGGSWRDATVAAIGDLNAPAPTPAPAPDGADGEAGDRGSDATVGFRCAVAPFTPVHALEDRPFTPYRAPQRELPRLAEPLVAPAPGRPLANLGILVPPQTDAGAPTWWPHLDGYELLDLSAVARVGAPPPPEAIAKDLLPPALADLRPQRALADLTLWADGWAASLRLVALERGSARIRWQRPLAAYGSSYTQAIGPRTLLASIFGANSDSLLAFALDDGAEVWRLDGAADGDFNRIRRLWIDDDRAYVLGDRGLAAVDPTTGAVLWSRVVVGQECGAISGADVVVIEEPGGGHRRIDGASGAELGRVGASAGDTCRWGKSEYDGGVALPVIDGGRLFVLDPPGRGGATLRALDLAGAGELWHADGLGQELLLADHDAVYVARGDERLVAIDAASGRPQVELSIGGTFDLHVALGGGPEAPLLIATSDETGTWILGRLPAPAVAEEYVIRGRLVVDEGTSARRAAGVLVRVGDKTVRTDASGRFRARGRTIGGVAVVPGDRRDPYELVEGGARLFRFDGAHVILDGSGAYDVGEIMVYEWTAA